MIAVAASRVRFEEKQILDCLVRRGTPHIQIDPRGVSVDARQPAFAFRVLLDREMAQTRGRYFAHLLEAAGVSVMNSARAGELCSDKVRSTLALAAAKVPIPRTRIALTADAARVAASELGFPIVIKPVTGSWGRLVSLVRDRDALEAVLEHKEALPSPQQHIVYLQEHVEKPGRDIRVVVIGGRALGAIYRASPEFRTNAARGAVVSPCPLDPVLEDVATRAAGCLGVEIAGVDIVEDQAGRFHVLEVNHVVEFRAFAEAHAGRLDVAESIVDLLVARLGAVG